MQKRELVEISKKKTVRKKMVRLLTVKNYISLGEGGVQLLQQPSNSLHMYIKTIAMVFVVETKLLLHFYTEMILKNLEYSRFSVCFFLIKTMLNIHFLYPLNPSVGSRGGWSLSQRSVQICF